MPPLATTRPAASEMISAGICVTRPSPTDSFVKTSTASEIGMPCRKVADENAAEDVDGGDDEAGDRIAAHELRGAVHGAEERAFLFELTPAPLRFALVDQAGRQVGVDGHLLAGNAVERESGADLGDARGALRDDDEVHRQEDDEHDDADDEVAAHDELGEAGDDVARAASRRARRR